MKIKSTDITAGTDTGLPLVDLKVSGNSMLKVGRDGTTSLGTDPTDVRLTVDGSLRINGPAQFAEINWPGYDPYSAFISQNIQNTRFVADNGGYNEFDGSVFYQDAICSNTGTSYYAICAAYFNTMEGDSTNEFMETDCLVAISGRFKSTDVRAGFQSHMYASAYSCTHGPDLNPLAKSWNAIANSCSIICQAGTMENAISYDNHSQVASDAAYTATLNTYTGLNTHVDVGPGHGTIGTFYDIYLGGCNISGFGVVTTKWGVYQPQTGYKNYWNSDSGFGTNAPSYKMHVVGSFGIRPGTSVTPVNNGDLVIEATSNTSCKIKLKGSDGVVRSVTLTLA